MKDNEHFDIDQILKGKDLIMTIKRFPRKDRRKFAVDRLFGAGSWICSLAFHLANDSDFDPNFAVKMIRDAMSDARDAIRILCDLLEEEEEQ